MAKGVAFFQINEYIHICLYIYLRIKVYIYIYIYVCVCVCVYIYTLKELKAIDVDCQIG